MDGADKPARFRMGLKAHKTSGKMWLIVCYAGTMFNYLSRWLNHQLQKLKPFVATYLKNSYYMLRRLQNLGALLPNAKLFTTDTHLMYTNTISINLKRA
ncbi:hypothetical protein ACHAWF_003345 [Thalassiosira exigua]